MGRSVSELLLLITALFRVLRMRLHSGRRIALGTRRRRTAGCRIGWPGRTLRLRLSWRWRSRIGGGGIGRRIVCGIGLLRDTLCNRGASSEECAKHKYQCSTHIASSFERLRNFRIHDDRECDGDISGRRYRSLARPICRTSLRTRSADGPAIAMRVWHHSAGVAAGCRCVSFGPVRAFSSSSQRLWCSLAQLRSTVPVPMASNAPSMPMVPI
jgi:hypothetical protein